nr:unnamed protein product [Digitaria exilis]
MTRQRGLYKIRSWETYTFGYDATTGLYKILHLPCREDVSRGFNVLQAFTLGHDASWRDVAVPGASCCPDAGIVSVGGAAYWVTNGVERFVCFDLKLERVAFDAPLPVGPGKIHLAEVNGRLGLVVRADTGTTPVTTEEVWVLGDGGDRLGWTRRYRVCAHGVGVEQQRLAAPYFAAHGGEYVVAMRTDERWRKHLHAHRLREAGIWLPRGEVRSVRISETGTVVASGVSGSNLRTFAYVETTEPLRSTGK